MSNPIDSNSYKHYLKFVSLGKTELYEICEFIGFDAAEYVREQDTGRHSQNVEYFAIDKAKFVSGVYGIKKSELQQLNPQGYTSYYLDMGFDWIIESLKQYGFNAEIYYYLSLNGVFFQPFQLFFEEKNLTDFKTFVECKLVQNGKSAEILRKFDDRFNAFSNENYKGELIEPINTFKVLRKSTSVEKVTVWENLGNNEFREGSDNDPNEFVTTFNFSSNIKESGLSFDYVPFDTIIRKGNLPEVGEEFRYFKASKATEKLEFSLQTKMNYLVRQDGDDSNSGRLTLFLKMGYDYLTAEIITLYNDVWESGIEKDVFIDQTFTHTFNFIKQGQSVWAYWRLFAFDHDVFGTSILSNQTIKATQTSLPTVIPCVRYVDLIQQSLNSINSIPLSSNQFSVNGVFYDQVCFTKSMVSQRLDKLYSTPKEMLESVLEVNADYELSEESCFIGLEDDFYLNEEIGVFSIIPSNDYNFDYNQEAMVNNFKLQYESYSNDRDIENSGQSIHTKSEWNILNKFAKNKFERNFRLVRDSIYIQDLIDREISDPSKKTDENEKILIQDVVNLPFGSYNEFEYTLLSKSYGNLTVEILNRQDTPETSEIIINWKVLGLSIGQIITLTANGSVFDYTVTDFNEQKLTLNSNTSNQFFNNGDNLIKFKYFYTGINYVMRTNEGFDIVKGVSSSFGNLAYSPKRLIKNYFSKKLSLMSFYSESLDIKNVFYKNNETVETKLITESSSLIENASINKSDLPLPNINPKVYNLELLMPYFEAVNYFNNYKEKRGYIRCNGSNGEVLRGFPRLIQYNPFTEKATIQLKEKYKTDKIFLTVNNSQKLELDGVEVKEWKFENDYFTAYDKKMRPLCESTLFNLVILNGISFLTKDELIINLQSL